MDPHTEVKDPAVKSTTFALSALGLLALSAPVAAAAAAPPDPIAYACFYCSSAEMEAVALSKGVGEHYVYDQAMRSMQGFVVTQQSANLVAAGFAPPRWVMTQYAALLAVYDAPTGAFVHVMKDVKLPAPGTPHTRSDVYLWGHHTTGLNPLHAQARDIGRRHIVNRLSLPYLDADAEHGRLIRFQTASGGFVPIIARLQISNMYLGQVDYLFDRGSNAWHYLQASDIRHAIPETAEDFTGPTGRRTFNYAWTHRGLADYFVQRAAWAGVQIVGQTMPERETTFVCTDTAGRKSCTLTWR